MRKQFYKYAEFLSVIYFFACEKSTLLITSILQDRMKNYVVVSLLTEINSLNRLAI